MILIGKCTRCHVVARIVVEPTPAPVLGGRPHALYTAPDGSRYELVPCVMRRGRGAQACGYIPTTRAEAETAGLLCACSPETANREARRLFLKPVVVDTTGSPHACGPKCRRAKSLTCKCTCGGTNHGADLAPARRAP